MSLINQALRKAQRDRTPDQMADPDNGTLPDNSTPAPVASATSSGKSMNLGLVIGLVVALAVLIGLVAGLSIALLRNNSPAPVAQKTQPSPATPPALKPATSAAPELAATNTLPVNGGDASSIVEELRLAREAAEAEAKAATKAAEEAAAKAAIEPSQQIIAWLSSAQINGVKISDNDSKVILNGKAYSAGEFVNYALGLKVMIIQEKRILFMDKNGKKYMKQL